MDRGVAIMDARQLAMVLVVAVVLVGALTVRYSRRLVLRRVTAAVIGVIAALAGYLTMVGYAIPALAELRSPGLRLGTTVLGAVLLWIVCLASLVLAVRLLLYAVRPPTAGPNAPSKS
jgi:hypothetical protein